MYFGKGSHVSDMQKKTARASGLRYARVYLQKSRGRAVSKDPNVALKQLFVTNANISLLGLFLVVGRQNIKHDKQKCCLINVRYVLLSASN